MIICLDISKRYIGISTSFPPYKIICREKTIIVKSINNQYQVKYNKKWKQDLINIYNKYNPTLTIIGLPSFGVNKEFIKLWAHSHRDLIKPFQFVNEDLSTQYSKNQDDVNQYSAYLILKKYLSEI